MIPVIKMLTKVRDWMLRQNLLHQGDRIVTGVSGGADSVCLLCLLAELREEFGLELHAVHVHHGIRGEEADWDAAFTRELCDRLGVSCEIVYRDVPEMAARERRSEEEMGRRVRYQVFEEYRQTHDCDWIAVAHNRDDNAETVLWNLCRGTGLAGLAGIRPVRDRIIRPLSLCSREEIENWLAARGQGYCTDRTNLTDDYTRNRIRHQVLPLLQEQVNRQAAGHIAETAERLAAIQDYLESQVAEQLRKVERIPGADQELCFFWKEEDYRACAPALQPEVILALLKQVSGRAEDFTAEHLRAVQCLFDREVGKEVHLPYGLAARRTYEGVRLEIRQTREGFRSEKQETGETAHGEQDEFPLIPDENGYAEVVIPGDNRIISCQIRDFDREFVKIPESSCVKWFDYDKIKDIVMVRTRRPSDRLVIHPDGRTKKLKSYWIDRKVPREERDGKWLLAAGSDILWIFGDRTGEGCRIDADTRRILTVQIKYGGQSDGR